MIGSQEMIVSANKRNIPMTKNKALHLQKHFNNCPYKCQSKNFFKKKTPQIQRQYW